MNRSVVWTGTGRNGGSVGVVVLENGIVPEDLHPTWRGGDGRSGAWFGITPTCKHGITMLPDLKAGKFKNLACQHCRDRAMLRRPFNVRKESPTPARFRVFGAYYDHLSNLIFPEDAYAQENMGMEQETFKHWEAGEGFLGLAAHSESLNPLTREILETCHVGTEKINRLEPDYRTGGDTPHLVPVTGGGWTTSSSRAESQAYEWPFKTHRLEIPTVTVTTDVDGKPIDLAHEPIESLIGRVLPIPEQEQESVFMKDPIKIDKFSNLGDPAPNLHLIGLLKDLSMNNVLTDAFIKGEYATWCPTGRNGGFTFGMRDFPFGPADLIELGQIASKLPVLEPDPLMEELDQEEEPEDELPVEPDDYRVVQPLPVGLRAIPIGHDPTQKDWMYTNRTVAFYTKIGDVAMNARENNGRALAKIGTYRKNAEGVVVQRPTDGMLGKEASVFWTLYHIGNDAIESRNDRYFQEICKWVQRANRKGLGGKIIDLGKYNGQPIKASWTRIDQKLTLKRVGRPSLTSRQIKTLWDIFHDRFPKQDSLSAPPPVDDEEYERYARE